MKAALVASLLAAASAGGSVKISWKDCGSSKTHGKTTDLKPTTVKLGEDTQMTGSGTVDKKVTGGSYSIEAKAGGGIIHQKFDGKNCEAKTFNLPLNVGTISWDGLKCPMAAGKASIGFHVKLSASIPASLAKSTIAMKAVDQDKEDLLCVNVETSAKADAEMTWEEYKGQFGKTYNGDEDAARKEIFEANKLHWGQHESGAILGATVFSDVTYEEFKAMNIRGLKTSSDLGLPKVSTHEYQGEELAESIDWTTKGAVTPVKNQGQCGSCWSFSTTGGLEGVHAVSSGNLVSMSEQQFVDCDHSDSGCAGGLMDQAFTFAQGTAIATEASYPYTARDGTCRSSFTPALQQGAVTGYSDVSRSADALKSALNNHPVSVGIEADQITFQQYTGGVITYGCGVNLDHGVLAVGYDGNTIKVKNSWGASWGVNGYVKMDASQCGVTNQASFPHISASVEI